MTYLDRYLRIALSGKGWRMTPAQSKLADIVTMIDEEPVRAGLHVFRVDKIAEARGLKGEELIASLVRLQTLGVIAYCVIDERTYGRTAVIWEPGQSLVIPLPLLASALQLATEDPRRVA